MMAIITKYLGPTNFHGARVKASCEHRSVIVSWDDALDIAPNHDNAAQQLMRKIGWNDSPYPAQWARGGSPDKKGYCYCAVHSNGMDQIRAF